MRKLFLLTISMIGLSGCGDWTLMSASLSNRSRQPVRDISVKLIGVTKHIDELLPGDSATVRVFSGGDGHICLTYRQGGARLQHGIGYLTHGLPIHYQIRIHDRHVSYLDDFFGSSDEVWMISHPDPPGKEC